MEPMNPTGVLFDPASSYPKDVFEHFRPVVEIFEGMLPLLGIEAAQGPITLLDIEAVLHGNYFVSKFLDHNAKVAGIDPVEVKADRHLLACLTALFALKTRDREIHESTMDDCVKRCRDLLGYIIDDNRNSKKEVLEALMTMKSEITEKIAEVRKSTIKPFKFWISPPTYMQRENKKQNPYAFFVHHYRRYVIYGLKPAQVRYHDENYYDTLQVWCTRHKVSFQSLFDDNIAREEQRRNEKQVRRDVARDMPQPRIEDDEE